MVPVVKKVVGVMLPGSVGRKVACLSPVPRYLLLSASLVLPVAFPRVLLPCFSNLTDFKVVCVLWHSRETINGVSLADRPRIEG